MNSEFSVGSIVLPASNGLLSQLGHDVVSLKDKALGIVVESKSNKCLVKFPSISLSTWVEKDELSDVWNRAQLGQADYKNLVPDFTLNIQRVPFIWTLFRLVQRLQSHEIISLEKGRVRDFIPEVAVKTAGLSEANLNETVWALGLGFEQWRFGTEMLLDEVLGSKLLWARVFPAGMHRLELLILFREFSI